MEVVETRDSTSVAVSGHKDDLVQPGDGVGTGTGTGLAPGLASRSPSSPRSSDGHEGGGGGDESAGGGGDQDVGDVGIESWQAKYLHMKELHEETAKMERFLEEEVEELTRINEEMKQQVEDSAKYKTMAEQLSEHLQETRNELENKRGEVKILEAMCAQSDQYKGKLERTEKLLADHRERDAQLNTQHGAEVERLQSQVKEFSEKVAQLTEIVRAREQTVDNLERQNREYKAWWQNYEEKAVQSEERAVLLEGELEVVQEQKAVLARQVKDVDDSGGRASVAVHARQHSILAAGLPWLEEADAADLKVQREHQPTSVRVEIEYDADYAPPAPTDSASREVGVGSTTPLKPFSKAEVEVMRRSLMGSITGPSPRTAAGFSVHTRTNEATGETVTVVDEGTELPAEKLSANAHSVPEAEGSPDHIGERARLLPLQPTEAQTKRDAGIRCCGSQAPSSCLVC